MSASGDYSAERRKGVLGSSDAAAALGLNPWKTPVRLYLEKRGEIVPEDISTKPAVAIGVALEPIVAAAFQVETGKKLHRSTVEYVHSGDPRIVAHPDYLHLDDETPVSIVECKTHGFGDTFGSVPRQWSGGVPEHIRIQVLHQAAVCAFPAAYVAELCPVGFFTHAVEFTNAELMELFLAEREFLARIAEGRPPAPLNEDDVDLLLGQAKPRLNGNVAIATDDIVHLSARYLMAKDIANSADRTVDSLKAKIMQFMGGAQELRDGEKLLHTLKTQSRTSVDAKSLRDMMPDVYRDFSRTTEYRVFR